MQYRRGMPVPGIEELQRPARAPQRFRLQKLAANGFAGRGVLLAYRFGLVLLVFVPALAARKEATFWRHCATCAQRLKPSRS